MTNQGVSSHTTNPTTTTSVAVGSDAQAVTMDEALGLRHRPTVSILLPTHTERAFIRDCLASIQRQDYDNILEVLVIDGGSVDGTRSVATKMGSPFRMVPNPGVTAATAMNIGIKESRGEVIVRMDAHALYARDYVSRCVAVLEETGADNVGGRMDPVGRTRFGRAVAAITSTPLVMGPGKFHYSTERSEVDTVFLGCWKRDTLIDLEGFDAEELQWAAEDHELNLRIRRRGGRIVLDPSIRSTYFPRDTLKGLVRQYHNYGLAKVSTLKKHRRLPSPRSLPPAALVASAAAGGAMFSGPARIAVPVAHAMAVSAIAKRTADATDADPIRCFLAVQATHWAFGVGFWQGIGRVMLGRPFTNNPSGHR